MRGPMTRHTRRIEERGRGWVAALMAAGLLAGSLLAYPCVARAEEDVAFEVGPENGTAEEGSLANASEPTLNEATGAVILDSGGNVVFAKNPEAQLPPASTTKVMTAMVILDSGVPLSDMVTLKRVDVGAGAQMADYNDGDQVSLGELLLVMLVYSGNDAAYNAAAYVAGSEEAFVGRMNAKAAELGMAHTHFSNSHGYEADDHYSCAYDLAVMGRHAMQNYPLIAQAVLLPQVSTTVQGYPTTLNSTDKLLGVFPGIRGVKTGAVTDSYTFVGAVGRGDHQFYSAVVGCATWAGRFADTTAMFDWAYAQLHDYPLSHSGWVMRLEPFAFDLGQRVVLGPLTDAVGKAWGKELGETTFSATLGAPGNLSMAGQAQGWVDAVQSGTSVGRSFVGTRPQTVRVSSWPSFALPLFEDTVSLGR